MHRTHYHYSVLRSDGVSMVSEKHKHTVWMGGEGSLAEPAERWMGCEDVDPMPWAWV